MVLGLFIFPHLRRQEPPPPRAPPDEVARKTIQYLDDFPSRLRAARGDCGKLATVLRDWEAWRQRLHETSLPDETVDSLEIEGWRRLVEMVEAMDEMQPELARCGTDEEFLRRMGDGADAK